MPSARPLFNVSTANLEETFQGNKADVETLKAILNELHHRSTNRARDLRAHVERALANLQGGKPMNSSASASNTKSAVPDIGPAVAQLEKPKPAIPQAIQIPQAPQQSQDYQARKPEPAVRASPSGVAGGTVGSHENREARPNPTVSRPAAETQKEAAATTAKPSEAARGAPSKIVADAAHGKGSNVSSELARKKNDLARILRYTKDLYLSSRKVVLDVDSERGYTARFHEKELVSLEGLTVNIDSETWVRLERIKETIPPAPGVIFDGWVAPQRHATPDTMPTLLPKRVMRIPAEEAEKLHEAGAIPDPSNILALPPSDKTDPNLRDVILYLKDQADLQKAWDSFLQGPWKDWAEIEKPRRRSISVYNQIFTAYQQIQSMGADTPMEMVLGLGIARWKTPHGRMSMPLIEQLIEADLEKDGTIIIRPRSVEPRLVLKPFHELEIPGAQALQQDAERDFYKVVRDPDVGFSPFSPASFENVLRACVARLSSEAQYLPDTTPNKTRVVDLPEPGDKLIISDSWIIFSRPRQEDFREADINRIIANIEAVENDDELPSSATRFIELPAGDNSGPKIDLGGGTLGGGDWEDDLAAKRDSEKQFFFPLPYNDEQMEIIRRLEDSDGVVVQGPPGTGKTHTIANIISHYMATGRRVLVTAKTAEALTALHDKLPQDVKNLAISIVHSDRDGANRLQSAVRILADEAKTVDVNQFRREIADAENKIAAMREESGRLEEILRDYALKNAEKIKYRGSEHLPMDLARIVKEEAETFDWFKDDIAPSVRHSPTFDHDDVSELGKMRKLAGSDIAYTTETLIDPAELPELPAILAAHDDLKKTKPTRDKAASGSLIYMSTKHPNAVQLAMELAGWLADFAADLERIKEEPWILSAYRKSIGADKAEDGQAATIRATFQKWANIYKLGSDYALRGINIDSEIDDKVIHAITNLAAGKEVFGLFSFFKGGLKEKLDRIRIEGRKPRDAADWLAIRELIQWNREVEEFLGYWNSIASALGFPTLPMSVHEAKGEILRAGRLISVAVLYIDEHPHRADTIIKLFPHGVSVMGILADGECLAVQEAIAVHIEQSGATPAALLRSNLRKLAERGERDLHRALRELADNLGDPEVEDGSMAEAWKVITREAARIYAKKPAITRIEETTRKISTLAPKWAEALRWAVEADGQSLTPENWQHAWEWAQAKHQLAGFPKRSEVNRISTRLNFVEAEIKKLLLDIIKRRTFIGLNQRLTAPIHVALQKFISAIAKLPKSTTAKSYVRYQRIIREAIIECAGAIPCWILPEWRVAEQLPPDLASFELAIVDEASQSNLLSLTSIMRAKKVLIVGDDKQVSPEAVGTDEKSIVQLRYAYLQGLPYADQMDPMTSLYELGSMIYPGKTLMLREHFRCVEPIIRFSSKFYDRPLIPLRIPSELERLDPPLIDIYIPHGRRHKTRKINMAEAEVVVDEIKKFIADARNAKRTIGVISLVGNEQAKLIHEMLMEEIGPEEMEKHHILCGDSATFQGQERDVVFLSMVSCRETSSSLTHRRYEQRFNVAMSRARDRIVLVRSVTASDLKEEDLKFKVIDHMRNPMGDGKVVRTSDVMSLCQSDFERDFANYMMGLGYRLHAQVPVAGYNIDFVIEGADNARLAIELDGDKWHGPERWAQDIHRQKSMERLGWKFWRCWGSNWIGDRDECIADLLKLLHEMKIEALGGEPVPGVYTEHITISPKGAPVFVGDASGAIASDGMTEDVSALSGIAGEDVVEVGDLVKLSYADTPEKHESWRISHGPNNLEQKILNASQPLAEAILGSSVGDEIHITINGQERVAVIEFIEKSDRALVLPLGTEGPIEPVVHTTH